MQQGGAECPRILVVDDDADFRESLSHELMTEGGFEVAAASDGFEAGYQFARARPHLVILDLMMQGMGGLDICDRIRRIERDRARIIVLTGFPEEETGETSLLSGADLVLTKPHDISTLIVHIRELLET